MTNLNEQTFEWQAEQDAEAVRRLAATGLLDQQDARYILHKIIERLVEGIRRNRQ